jgi:hypothetical protein
MAVIFRCDRCAIDQKGDSEGWMQLSYSPHLDIGNRHGKRDRLFCPSCWWFLESEMFPLDERPEKFAVGDMYEGLMPEGRRVATIKSVWDDGRKAHWEMDDGTVVTMDWQMIRGSESRWRKLSKPKS